ncbi:MAG: phytoene/squalene synthase family protein [Cyclobacteriaceae bacterium]
MDLYSTTALKCSKLITQHYSTSFTLGIKTLDRKLHLPIYAIYGFVRYADEIVDTFHNHDKAELLKRFEEDAYRAIEERISLNPVLHSFQLVVNEYHIDKELIAAFLKSMEMDLHNETYNQDGYEEYIYGSAEVIGLMCLKVFTNGDQKSYEHLRPTAKKLGAAFQKVNFLRDIQSDFKDRGRVYFPGVDFTEFTESDKQDIEKDITQDFAEALIGIKQLPKSARAGVYLAYVYYLQLFKKIKGLPSSKIANSRVRVPDSIKFFLLLKTLIANRLNIIK